MVKIEFFPETATFSFKPQKSHAYIEDPLLTLVLKYKQDFSTIKVAEPISLDYLIKENFETKQSISLPKRETLGEEFTDEDYEKLCTKLAYQNEQFKNHRIRDVKGKVERLKVTFSRLTTEEIFTALKDFDYNEEEVTMLLTKNEFIGQLRSEIAQFRQNNPVMKIVENEPITPITPMIINEAKIDKLFSLEPSSVNGSEEVSDSDPEDEEFESESEEFIKESLSSSSLKRKPHSHSHSLGNKKASRLRLDDALANAADMEGWSEARVRAYQSMKKNPNSYFYRFNAPGEMQRNGPWSKEEDEAFMKRLNEFGADGQWGIFSMTIPGRVGYQCSNYYRKLIEIGRIRDSNYRLDEKGKAHYIGGKTKANREIELETDGSSDLSDSEAAGIKPTPTDEFISANVTSYRSNAYENPLPNFIDSITQTEVVRPAISPYGHVLSYDTWLKCLLNGDRKNTCPLTNQPLHKRQLIFLTRENIEMYRDKIRRDL